MHRGWISSTGAGCSLEGWRDAADNRGLQGRAAGLDRAGSLLGTAPGGGR